MKPEEIEALSATMAAVVREQVDAATRPLLERIASLEAREPPTVITEKGDQGERGQDGIDGKDGLDGKDGRDGLDAVEFIRDANGHLIATLSNGTTKDLGKVDGDKGATGKDGRDGADGVGFDDLDVIHDGVRGFTFRFTKGDRVKEFPFTLPVVIDKGIYRDGTGYDAGDGVTWAGSFWIAQENTAEKPDSGKGWRLAVKRGRDGKDAPAGPEKSKQPLRVGVPARGE